MLSGEDAVKLPLKVLELTVSPGGEVPAVLRFMVKLAGNGADTKVVIPVTLTAKLVLIVRPPGLKPVLVILPAVIFTSVAAPVFTVRLAPLRSMVPVKDGEIDSPRIVAPTKPGTLQVVPPELNTAMSPTPGNPDAGSQLLILFQGKLGPPTVGFHVYVVAKLIFTAASIKPIAKKGLFFSHWPLKKLRLMIALIPFCEMKSEFTWLFIEHLI
jgi:hypothetical protein